ncbi:MAG: glutathione S-transferase family protein [Gammaproteobacteria bacterium]
MIKLHQFPAVWGLPNPSPFCMKVETYMRMADLVYEVIEDPLPFKAPKKKLPFIEDGGRRIADSEFIIEYLKACYGDPLDAGLTATERALAHGLRRMLEEGLYWVVAYSRWEDDAGWAVIKPVFFKHLPAVARGLIPVVARYQVRKALWLQGTGRHSRDEVYRLGAADIAAVAGLLGNQPFVLGARPSAIDAVVYAFMANAIVPPIDSPIRDAALAHPRLVAYCERMRQRYFTAD